MAESNSDDARMGPDQGVGAPNSGGVYVKILEQPLGYSRFRYASEKNSGCLLGCSSNKSHVTYPTIQIVGYQGRAAVAVSCVTIDDPYRPHPHKLIGQDCTNGVYFAEINNEQMIASIEGLSIQRVLMKDVENSLRERSEEFSNIPLTAATHSSNVFEAKHIDHRAVRLCFDVSLAGMEPGKFTVPVPRVVSAPIIEKSYQGMTITPATIKSRLYCLEDNLDFLLFTVLTRFGYHSISEQVLRQLKTDLFCIICHIEFTHLEEYKKHLVRHIPVGCGVCDLKFTSTRSLESHSKKHSALIKPVPSSSVRNISPSCIFESQPEMSTNTSQSCRFIAALERTCFSFTDSNSTSSSTGICSSASRNHLIELGTSSDTVAVAPFNLARAANLKNPQVQLTRIEEIDSSRNDAKSPDHAKSANDESFFEPINSRGNTNVPESSTVPSAYRGKQNLKRKPPKRKDAVEKEMKMLASTLTEFLTSPFSIKRISRRPEKYSDESLSNRSAAVKSSAESSSDDHDIYQKSTSEFQSTNPIRKSSIKTFQEEPRPKLTDEGSEAVGENVPDITQELESVIDDVSNVASSSFSLANLPSCSTDPLTELSAYDFTIDNDDMPDSSQIEGSSAPGHTYKMPVPTLRVSPTINISEEDRNVSPPLDSPRSILTGSGLEALCIESPVALPLNVGQRDSTFPALRICYESSAALRSGESSDELESGLTSPDQRIYCGSSGDESEYERISSPLIGIDAQVNIPEAALPERLSPFPSIPSIPFNATDSSFFTFPVEKSSDAIKSTEEIGDSLICDKNKSSPEPPNQTDVSKNASSMDSNPPITPSWDFFHSSDEEQEPVKNLPVKNSPLKRKSSPSRNHGSDVNSKKQHLLRIFQQIDNDGKIAVKNQRRESSLFQSSVSNVVDGDLQLPDSRNFETLGHNIDTDSSNDSASPEANVSSPARSQTPDPMTPPEHSPSASSNDEDAEDLITFSPLYDSDY